MYFLGTGGEHMHDAGLSVLDEQGNIVYASQAERQTGLKHSAHFRGPHFKEWWNKFPNTVYSITDSWEERLKFRKGILDPNKNSKQLYGVLDDIYLNADKYPRWQRHPAQREYEFVSGHHAAHAAAAYFTRPTSFKKEECVMVVIDGIGEMRSALVMDSDFNVVHEVNFPKSIGYLYATMTMRLPNLELSSNEDEYVVMGLSSYGEPTHWEGLYEMFNCIPEWKNGDQMGFEDSTWLEKYDQKMMYLDKMCDYLLDECKNNEDVAASMQRCVEELILDIMKIARKYGNKLCYSGGVAQNIKANSRVDELFDDMWVDLNPGDAGASLGCAAMHWAKETGGDRINWTHPYLGDEIEGDLDPELVVEHLLKHKVCGVANGRAEFSYRAYGNRSLIADVREEVKDTVNNIKQRQLYRPFAPAILEEHAGEYFEGKMNHWMQYVAKAKHPYSSVTHVDGTGRVQLVGKDCQSVFRKILECYYVETGVPMLLNTSLNIRKKPMVNTVQDALEFQEKYGVKVFTS